MRMAKITSQDIHKEQVIQEYQYNKNKTKVICADLLDFILI